MNNVASTAVVRVNTFLDQHDADQADGDKNVDDEQNSQHGFIPKCGPGAKVDQQVVQSQAQVYVAP